MKLNAEQQKVVNENIGLVGKVIKDKVHGAGQLGIYSYDDIFQIGCIGLCKAAYTDKGGCFSTYAYRLIWNEICSSLIYASKRTATEYSTDPDLLAKGYPMEEAILDDYADIEVILSKALQDTGGVTAKGIKAIHLIADGYTSREIGELMGASPNNVTAWISKARKFLRTRPELMAI